ncbi:MAG: type III secretion system translocon subunit SctE [Succinatimonas sp.]|nr:type III secretion system translocon subunit SctE [Succinatimonas sp.]
MDFSKISSNMTGIDAATMAAEAAKLLKDVNIDPAVLANIAKATGANVQNSGIGSAPTLQAPDAKVLDKISTLSTDALMSMLGAQERETTVKTGVASLQANADEVKAKNEERIQNLREQIEKAEKEKHASFFKKIFSWVATIVSAVVAVATVVVGVMTANPLLIVGGAFLAISAADQITQLATGKTMFTHFAEVCGANENVAAWVGLGLGLAVGITGAILSGVGIAKSAGALSNAAKAINYVEQGINGVTTVASGAATIATSVYAYQGANLKAANKDLEAILAKLQMLQQMDLEHLEAIMNKYSSMVESVNEIVKQNGQTLTKVMTGGAAMA